MEVIGERVCLLLFTGLWRHGILTLCSTRVLCKGVQSFAVFPTFNHFFTEAVLLVFKYHPTELVSFRSICFACAVVTYFRHLLSEVRTIVFLFNYLIVEPQFTLFFFGYSLCLLGVRGCPYTFWCSWSIHLTDGVFVHPFNLRSFRNLSSSKFVVLRCNSSPSILFLMMLITLLTRQWSETNGPVRHSRTVSTFPSSVYMWSRVLPCLWV